VILPSDAEQLIRRLMAEARWPDDAYPDAAWVRSQAKRLTALAVNLDLWSWWFLAPTGEVILVAVGDDTEHKRYDDRGHVLVALVWASESYPELRQVLPQRPPDAVDCRCAEIQRTAEKTFLCTDCGDLGWLPAV